MSAQRVPTTGSGNPTAPRRSRKGQVRQPNRAQVRAAEARSRVAPAAPVVAEAVTTPVEVEVGAGVAAPARSRGSAPVRSRATARPIVLTRAEEYRYIRSDLRRLLITAGAILLVMLVLLVIFET